MLLSNSVLIETPFPQNRDVKLCKRCAFQNGFLLDLQTAEKPSTTQSPAEGPPSRVL